MLIYDSVHEGVEALREYAASNRRTVFALLSFQRRKLVKTCFLFKSEGDAASRLIKNYPDLLRIEGFPQNEMRHVLAVRQASINLELLNPQGLGVQPKGHAEEFLIQHFDECCRIVGDIKKVTIYLSLSPCTSIDRNASNSLDGWPTSCTEKFAHLADLNPKYFFSICFDRRFGTLSGSNSIETDLKGRSGNLPNLAFVWLQ